LSVIFDIPILSFSLCYEFGCHFSKGETIASPMPDPRIAQD
jgi:hypothetical protein